MLRNGGTEGQPIESTRGDPFFQICTSVTSREIRQQGFISLPVITISTRVKTFVAAKRLYSFFVDLYAENVDEDDEMDAIELKSTSCTWMVGLGASYDLLHIYETANVGQ